MLSTPYATNTTGAIERLLNFFPLDAREAILKALIRRGELETLRQAIEDGVHEGLQTLVKGTLIRDQRSEPWTL